MQARGVLIIGALALACDSSPPRDPPPPTPAPASTPVEPAPTPAPAPTPVAPPPTPPAPKRVAPWSASLEEVPDETQGLAPQVRVVDAPQGVPRERELWVRVRDKSWTRIEVVAPAKRRLMIGTQAAKEVAPGKYELHLDLVAPLFDVALNGGKDERSIELPEPFVVAIDGETLGKIEILRYGSEPQVVLERRIFRARGKPARWAAALSDTPPRGLVQLYISADGGAYSLAEYDDVWERKPARTPKFPYMYLNHRGLPRLERLRDAQLIAYSTWRTKVIERCPRCSTSGFNSTTRRDSSCERKRYIVDIDVHVAATGKRIAKKHIDGPLPPPCADDIHALAALGEPPSDEVTAWLRTFIEGDALPR